MSGTCSLLSPPGDPWPSCLLPSHQAPPSMGFSRQEYWRVVIAFSIYNYDMCWEDLEISREWTTHFSFIFFQSSKEKMIIILDLIFQRKSKGETFYLVLTLYTFVKNESVSHSVISYSLWPNGLQLSGLFYLCNSPGKITRLGNHSLLQGIFHTQGLNPGLLHCT